MGKGKKGDQIFNEDNDAVHETMALIQKDGMKPTKEEIDAMEAGGAGRGEPTIKAPDAPAEKKDEAAAGPSASFALIVAGLFFLADIGKNVIEANVAKGFGGRVNTSFLMFLLNVLNLLAAVALTYIRQGSEGLKKLPDLEKIKNFSLPAVFFGMQGSLMLLASTLLESGSMRKVLGQMRIPLTMIFSGSIMGATFTGLQKLAVGMILVSVWMFIVVVDGGGSVLQDKLADVGFLCGLGVMILANLSAVFGTLVSEKFLKKGAKTSFYIQMFHIQCTQVVISLFMWAFITPYVFGNLFSVLLGFGPEKLSSQKNNVYEKNNPFAIRSNMMLTTASGGYPFGELLKSVVDPDLEAAAMKNYATMRKSVMDKMSHSVALKTLMMTSDPSHSEFIAECTAMVDLLMKEDTSAEDKNAIIVTLDKRATEDSEKYAEFINKYTEEKKNKVADNVFVADAEKQIQLFKSTMITHKGQFAESDFIDPEPKKDAPQIFSKEEKALIEALRLEKLNSIAIKSTLAVKFFAVKYIKATKAVTKAPGGDKKYMTSYPFVRKTQTQQNKDISSNFVLSSKQYFEDHKNAPSYGEQLHGSVFKIQKNVEEEKDGKKIKKEDQCAGDVCVFKTSKVEVAKLDANGNNVKKDTMEWDPKTQSKKSSGDKEDVKEKISFQVGLYENKSVTGVDGSVTEQKSVTGVDTVFVTVDGAAPKALIQCYSPRDETQDQTLNTESFHDFTAYSKGQLKNIFLKKCKVGTKFFSMAQQPGKFGAGSYIMDKTGAGKHMYACDHRCAQAKIQHMDFSEQGKWTNLSDELIVPEQYLENQKNEDNISEPFDDSKFAYIPSSCLFTECSYFTQNPLAGMFDTWLLLVAALCNMGATWMSALVTKALSSLHKQIISAVCLAAINFIEYFCFWAPSKNSKIAFDNFLFGVAGVILSALLYSQAPKAPKKVEAKKD